MVYDPRALIAPSFLRHADGSLASLNERSILRILQRNPGLSRADLTGRLDLTQQSLHRIVDQLAGRKMIRLGPPRAAAGRGQPSPTLHLRPAFAHSWGLSLNACSLGIALMDFTGAVLADEMHTILGMSRAEVLALASRRIDALSATHRLDPDCCLGIGFGMAGYRIDDTRFAPPEHLHEWALLDLGPLLSERFRAPVWVELSSNTAAIAEAFLGIGRSVPTFAHVSLNYWMGSGMIQDGVLWDGGFANAGELSGLCEVEPKVHHPALEHLVDLLRGGGAAITSVLDLRHAIDMDDTAVGRWLHDIMPGFNRVLAAIWTVFDPQAVVLGGLVPPRLARQMLDQASLPRLRRYGEMRRLPKLLLSDLGPNAAALGAAAHPLRSCVF